MEKIIKNILFGIAWGCTIFVIFGIIHASMNGDSLMTTSDEFIKQAICSIIVGIGFCVPSISYDNDKISRPLQVLIHMCIGLTVYIVTALYAGWMPVECGLTATIITVVMLIIISFMIWFGFYIYNKHEAKK